MKHALENPAALKSVAQIVPEYKGEVLAVQDTNETTQYVVYAAATALFLVFMVGMLFLFRRRRHRRS